MFSALVSEFYTLWKPSLAANLSVLYFSTLQSGSGLMGKPANREIMFSLNQQKGLPWVISTICRALRLFQEGLTIFCCSISWGWNRLHSGMPSWWPQGWTCCQVLSNPKELELHLHFYKFYKMEVLLILKKKISNKLKQVNKYLGRFLALFKIRCWGTWYFFKHSSMTDLYYYQR